VDQINLTADGPDYHLIAQGTANVNNAVVAKFDPTTFNDDSYVIRIRATDKGGLVTAKSTTVSVSSNAKLGQFSLEFTDLSIPLVGIPIQVIRRYNTFHASDSGDFGYGWRLAFGEADIRNATPAEGGPIDPSMFYDGRTRVYLTTPEGKRVGFTFAPDRSIQYSY
jgi:hypothetical protein